MRVKTINKNINNCKKVMHKTLKNLRLKLEEYLYDVDVSVDVTPYNVTLYSYDENAYSLVNIEEIEELFMLELEQYNIIYRKDGKPLSASYTFTYKRV